MTTSTKKQQGAIGTAEFKMVGIEILPNTITSHSLKYEKGKVAEYDLRIETNVKKENRTITAIVNVTVRLGKDVMAEYGASFIYEIVNFEETIKQHGKEFQVPTDLSIKLNEESVSTIRGLMFSHFRGTRLQATIFPVISIRQSMAAQAQK